MLLDIKKLFTKGSSLGRIDYFRIAWEFPILSLFFVQLAIMVPPDNWLSYPTAMLALVSLLSFWVIYLAAAYKRLNNIFENTVVSVILLVVIGFGSIFKPLYIIYNVLLIFLPGKKKADRVVSCNFFWMIIFPLLIILFPIKILGVNRWIPSQAMSDTLQVRDRVVINVFDKNYQRGDIIVHSTNKKGVDYVKRIIALPGEKVEIKQQPDGAFYIFINDKMLDEPYVKDSYDYPELSSMQYAAMTVPDNSYYVLGDNRGNSFDSRYYGSIHKNLIKGKISHIWYPFNRRQVFTPLKYSFNEVPRL